MMSPLWTRELKSASSRAIVPDTCEPTCTLITALMVPVASTASRISPRCTLAVNVVQGLIAAAESTCHHSPTRIATESQSAEEQSARRRFRASSTGARGSRYSYRRASIGSRRDALRAG